MARRQIPGELRQKLAGGRHIRPEELIEEKDAHKGGLRLPRKKDLDRSALPSRPVEFPRRGAQADLSDPFFVTGASPACEI